MEKPLLELKDISKTYGGIVKANDHASFDLLPGEIHALAGENGAGKTTLMKVLYGLEKADSGAIFLYGNKTEIHDPNDSIKHGIGMVHQHFMLVDDLNVAENVVLGMEPKRHVGFDAEKARNLVLSLGKEYGMELDPDKKVENLNVAQKQKVEIMKVLARNANIIILDEPTAVLTPLEVELFFRQLLALKKSGKSIVIITHKIREIKEICDRVTIMRAGKTVGTYPVKNVTEAGLSGLMVGFEYKPVEGYIPRKYGDNVLALEHVNCLNENGKTALDDISFFVREREILGVIGVEGNGQEELAGILSGKIKEYQGRVTIAGQDIKNMDMGKIRALGLGYISEDRMEEGADLKGTLLDNATSVVYRESEFQQLGVISSRKTRRYTQNIIDEYNVKCNNYREEIKNLSGGNMQKIVSGREIGAARVLLVANQPTRGVDVAAVMAIHKKIQDIQKQGRAILLISSDLAEIYQLCENAIILYGGRIVARIDNLSQRSEQEIGRYMLGLDKIAEKGNDHNEAAN